MTVTSTGNTATAGLKVNVKPNAPDPTPCANPSAVDFGTLGAGGQQSQVVTLSNCGAGTLKVLNDASLSGAGASAYKLTVNNCTSGKTLNNATPSCDVKVRFLAPATAGTYNANLVFKTQVGNQAPVTTNVPLVGKSSGSGGGGGGGGGGCQPGDPGLFSASPDPLTFVDGSETTKTITISNTGCSALNLGAYGLASGSSSKYSINGGSCTTTLAAGDTCTVLIRFNGGDSTGRTATLETSSGNVAITGT